MSGIAHQLYSDVAHVVEAASPYVVAGAEVAAGAALDVAAVVGVPFTLGGSLGLAAVGTSLIVAGGVGLAGDVASQQQAAAEQAYTGSTGGTSPGSTDTYSGPAAAGTNAPGASTAVVPTQSEIYQEQARAANIAQASFETQAGGQILNLKVQEQSAESSIRASTAARGLTLSGSPLFQLASQQQRGGTAIGLAESSFAASDQAQSLGNEASWNQSVLNLAESNFAIQVNQQNQWLQGFSNALSFGTSLLSGAWNPAASSGGGSSSTTPSSVSAQQTNEEFSLGPY